MNCPACSADNVDGARFCAKCGALIPPQEAVEERDPLIGQTLGGRYVITRKLGEGGMGMVYEAERQLAGIAQRVAIKTLHQHLSSDPSIVARFHRECQTIAQLRHPNTIRVEDFGQAADGTLYLAMEFVEGKSVEKALEDGPMPPERVERIMGQVCGSLAEAHKQGVVHRDLKPDNVVLMDVADEKDVVKVLDFGIAARKDSTDEAKEKKLTQQGMVLGTPPYMSPEQFRGQALDARSDIYSLGVMSYEMLTGKLPFEANTPWEWATKHMTAQPFPFDDQPTVSDVPAKMKDAILRALAKDPNDRQGTAREFFEELSIGTARMMGLTTLGEVHNAPVTGGLAAVGGPAPPGGATQIATPAAPQAPGAAATPTPMGTPLPSAPDLGPPAKKSNAGFVIGAVVGVVVIGGVAAGVVMMTGGKKDPGGEAHASASASTSTTATSKATATTTATAPPTVVKTAMPCSEVSAMAGGNPLGAIAALGSCTGDQAGARRAIANAIPNAVRYAAFNNQCARARQIAAAGPQVGAASVNVDAQYPNCRGK